MKKKNNRLSLLAVFALLMITACAMMSGGIFSKYVGQQAVANQAEYNHTLAEEFQLLDQPIIQNEDGSYAKDETADAEPTDGYTYKLIPGITLPAAPYVEIKGKTALPAYLYVEVKNTGGVTLSFDDDWTPLGVTGKMGGDVYGYGSDALTGSGDSTVDEYPIFTVDALDSVPLTDEGEIKVYAYLIEKVGDQTAEDCFSEAPQP